MKKIKKFFVILVAVCALFCTVGCSVQDYFDKIDSTLDGYINSTLNSTETETSTSSEESSSDEVGNSSSSSVEDEETETLVTPDNVLDYVVTDWVASPIFLPIESADDYGNLYVRLQVPSTLKTLVDSNDNTCLAILFVEQRLFEAANGFKYKYFDWVSQLDICRVEYQLQKLDITVRADNEYSIEESFPIVYEQVNTVWVAMGVLITTDSDGNETYKYSTYSSGDYRTNARSLAYVAAESLSKYALGDTSIWETEDTNEIAAYVDSCKTYVNWSVDLANWLTEPTDDDSTYSVTVSPTAITLNVGETATVNVSVAQDVNVPVAYKVYHSGIAMVSDNGVVKALSAGNTIVVVYVAGVSYVVNIKVTGD